MINVEHVSKIYGDGSAAVTALNDVSLTVGAGEIFGIIGRSGAGKTTLLRCLNLLERPTSGRILLDGTDLFALTEKELRSNRRRIGIVFQQFNLLHSRTVARNIEFPLQVAGWSKAERAARVNELLELVGLSDKRDAYPSQLSGGQKQRVGIARALAARPDVLLCDEATSALDSETTTQILDLLRQINREVGVTIVLITHELDVVRRICTSAALIDAGRVIDTGRLDELVADPHSVLGDALLPTHAEDTAHTGVEALLTFVDTLADQPIISRLSRELHIDVTVLAGGIERIGGRHVGRLRVVLHSVTGEMDFPSVRDYLVARGVRVEAA